jgi:GT2 family glycosyltransferase
MSREVHREVGPLDEAFEVGMFEDEDYCRRVEQTGRRLACALDVFVHHRSAAAFDAIDQTRRWELFERNRQTYEAKWGPWRPGRFKGQSGKAGRRRHA